MIAALLDATVKRCHICPGLAAVSAMRDCERIVIHGDRTPAGFMWRVDVITPLAAGHRQGHELDAAISEAIRQAMEQVDEEAEET